MTEWTKQTELFVIEGLVKGFSNLSLINFELKKSKEYRDLGLRQMEEIFGITNKLPVPVTTVHQVRGMTLDCVLLVLNKTSIANNVSFKELSTHQEFPKEKQRIIYVAMSRPKHLLAIGLPDKIPDNEIKRKLGDKIEIIK